tara:strand:+ start:321 stop:575 length:255 start_codon:yes stop_codon:yes gene_type:complete
MTVSSTTRGITSSLIGGDLIAQAAYINAGEAIPRGWKFLPDAGGRMVGRVAARVDIEREGDDLILTPFDEHSAHVLSAHLRAAA